MLVLTAWIPLAFKNSRTSPPNLASRSNTRLFAFEHGELLAKSGGLQTEAVPREEERATVGNDGKNEGDHHFNRR
jgi:hypothetical protein